MNGWARVSMLGKSVTSDPRSTGLVMPGGVLSSNGEGPVRIPSVQLLLSAAAAAAQIPIISAINERFIQPIIHSGGYRMVCADRPSEITSIPGNSPTPTVPKTAFAEAAGSAGEGRFRFPGHSTPRSYYGARFKIRLWHPWRLSGAGMSCLPDLSPSGATRRGCCATLAYGLAHETR